MSPQAGTGVGARVRRNEDRRHLHGAGRFVADIRLPRMQDAAFLRSPVAHARLGTVEGPADGPAGVVRTAEDLSAATRPIVAVSGREGFRASEYPVLATDKVRFVGEPIAVAVAADRARAEDLVGRILVDFEELPAVVDRHGALEPDAPLLHEHWPDNRFIAYDVDLGDLDAAAAAAAVTITREFDLARTSGVPLEGRGVVASYDGQADQLVVYSSTQWPHVVRTKLAELLGLEERRLRVVAPDVGGGFGVKNNVYPEEVVVAALALELGHPVRWIEDRWEHLVASAQAREHHYRITAHADRDGVLTGLEAQITVNAGAYSVWPWTAAMEAGMASGIIPGPYRLRNYRFTATTVATNTPPLGPYRGVARPGACFAIERTLDEVAHTLGLEPRDVRLRNMIGPDEFPYTSVTGMEYDSGDFPATVRTAAEAIGHDRVRAEQGRIAPTATRRLGLGYASYTEQTAHGVEEWDKRGLPVVFGFETARVTFDPSGTLTVDVGIQSHGQGLETTLAQVANEVLGVGVDRVTVRHGDTGISPYGMGTFASRSMVMAGGATYRACQQLADKILRIGAHLLGCSPEQARLDGQRVVGPDGDVALAEIADAAYLHLGRIPPDIEPGLEVTYRYRPEVGTGTFSSSTHAVTVDVDLDTGTVQIVDYVVVEDCGTVVNPMIVDGQVHGGVAQGIGQALYEESRFDAAGQPRCTTFMDYLLPGATEVPDIRVEHLETPSPFTVLGMKGMGEGGAIAPPAAIANAVTDALRDLGVSVGWTPITPASVWNALERARQGRPADDVETEAAE